MSNSKLSSSINVQTSAIESDVIESFGRPLCAKSCMSRLSALNSQPTFVLLVDSLTSGPKTLHSCRWIALTFLFHAMRNMITARGVQ